MYCTVYWALTGFFSLAMVAGGLTETFAVPYHVSAMKQLGYPLYILPFPGLAKLLGVTAILSGKSIRLKEWAYAGFCFDLLGAAYSHLMVSQAKEAVPPLIFLVIGGFTYALWKQQSVSEQPALIGLARAGERR